MKSETRLLLIVLLVLFLMWLFAQLSEPAAAQGPVTPQPTPAPTQNPVDAARNIDAANALAEKWRSVADAALVSSQNAINYAYSALANAQSGLAQVQAAFNAEHAARVAAQQGQIQQAVQSAQNAQLSAANAIALMSAATSSSMTSLTSASAALRAVPELKVSLAAVTAQRDAVAAQRDAALAKATQLDNDRTALGGALVAERERSDLYGKVAIAALLLLAVTLIYIAMVLWKLMRALHIQPRDRMVILDERGRVKTQIEALH